LLKTWLMTTEANFPLQQLCLKPSLYGRFSLDHLWPLLGDHQGLNFSGHVRHLPSLSKIISCGKPNAFGYLTAVQGVVALKCEARLESPFLSTRFRNSLNPLLQSCKRLKWRTAAQRYNRIYKGFQLRTQIYRN
jgi:hypothetical protein